MNITEPIRRIARLTPDAIALVRADGGTISYAVLEHAIDRMATHAQRLDLKPGDNVGLTITGPDESLGLTLMLALARIGVASTEPPWPRHHLRFCFQSGPTITPGNVAFDASWTTSEVAGPDHKPVAIHDNPDAVWRIMSSSGTTGLPKHIVVTHRQQHSRITMKWLADGGGRATRIIGIGLGSTLGLLSVLHTLWASGTIVLSDPKNAWAAIERYGVTSLITTPVSLRAILESMPPGTGPFPTLATIDLTGSSLPPALHHMATARLCPNILSIMGSTEVAGIASAPMSVLASRPGAAGYIWPGVEVQATDENRQKLPVGSEGVLRIRSPMVASGYLPDDDDPWERFEDGWFYSADIGTVGQDGMLYLNGRATDVINAGGVKVNPVSIERVLTSLPTVDDAAVFGVPDATGLIQIWAAIVAKSRIDDEVLNSFCRHALPSTPPRTILQMKTLPRNENGKVMREQLVDLAVQVMRRENSLPPGSSLDVR